MAFEILSAESRRLEPGDLLTDGDHTFLVICYERLYVHSPGRYRMLRCDGHTVEFSWEHMKRKGWRRLA